MQSELLRFLDDRDLRLDGSTYPGLVVGPDALCQPDGTGQPGGAAADKQGVQVLTFLRARPGESQHLR